MDHKTRRTHILILIGGAVLIFLGLAMTLMYAIFDVFDRAFMSGLLAACGVVVVISSWTLLHQYPKDP